MSDIGELAEIRRDLREMRWYIEDDGLRTRVSEWIQESHNRKEADTAREWLEQRLNALLAEHEMYHAPELARGEDGFPKSCSECRHYGTACPVLLDDVETRWRERRLEEAETEAEARRVYETQAIDVDCKQIPRLLEKWDNRHKEFIQEGQVLLEDVEEHIRTEDGPDGEAPETALSDGGIGS